MNEIRRKKVVKILPGSDRVTQDMVAYSLHNTIITGRVTSGVYSAINNILLNLIQNYSPSELNLQIFDVTGCMEPWLNQSRRIPQMRNQEYNIDYVEDDYENLVEALVKCHIASNYRSMGEPTEFTDHVEEKTSVVVISLDTAALENESVHIALRALLHSTMSAYSKTKIILVTESQSAKLLELEEFIWLRILTRTSDEISNAFLGCNLASIEERVTGHIWVTSIDDFYTKKNLEVPFRPFTLYSKFCKYLSNDKTYAMDNYDRVHYAMLANFDEYMRIVLEHYIERASEGDKNFANTLISRIPLMEHRTLVDSIPRMYFKCTQWAPWELDFLEHICK